VAKGVCVLGGGGLLTPAPTAEVALALAGVLAYPLAGIEKLKVYAWSTECSSKGRQIACQVVMMR